MSPQSRLVAGIVLILVPTVEIGGASILSLLIADPSYTQNALRQDLWRAGHAHAGVWLVLTLVALRYVDEASLSEGMRWVVRVAFPAAAILMPLAFFLSVLSPEATEPNAMIYLAYVAGVVLAVGLLVLGVGLIRGVGPCASLLNTQEEPPCVRWRGLPLFIQLPRRVVFGNPLGPGPLGVEFPREIPHAAPFLYLTACPFYLQTGESLKGFARG